MEKTLISRFQYGKDIFSLYELNYGTYRRYGVSHCYTWTKQENLDNDDYILGTFPENSKERAFTYFGSLLTNRLGRKND